MTTYKLYQRIANSYQYDLIAEYDFECQPQAGDTIELGKGLYDVWVIRRRHWKVDGSVVLIVENIKNVEDVW